jgi:multiple sugar transport system permease protein
MSVPPRRVHDAVLIETRTRQVPPAVTSMPSERGTSTPLHRRSNRRWQRLARRATPYLFLTPFLVGFAVFVIYPLAYAVNLSIFRTKIIGGKSFIGIDNYTKAFHDPVFWAGVGHVVAFGVVQIPIMIGIALLGALLLDSGIIRRQRLVRLAYFLPFAVPSVVAALVWGYLYGQSFGPVAQIAHVLGFQAPTFLTPGAIIPALANISTWQYTGYNMVIMFAALKTIPPELIEAARMDGAGGLQIAWRIRIPLIAPAIVLTLIFSIIGTLQLFNEPQILNTIAPTAVGPNFTPNLYVYTLAFRNQEFDYSAAIAFSLAAVTSVFASMFLLVSHRRAALD